MSLQILQGDCRDLLPGLPSDSVDCCVTSPPYWRLRDYGVEGQLGQEETPEEFIETMTAVFREVRRILKPEGTCWVNMGDSYASAAGGGQGKNGGRADRTFTPRMKSKMAEGLKAKDLVGMPWLLAFALRADGWFLRQDIIWHKPNPMPESIGDRCTKAHEYVFLLTKSARYYFDAEAIKEKASENTNPRQAGNGYKTPDGWDTSKGKGGHGTFHKEGREKGRKPGNVTPPKGQAAYEAGATEHRTKGGLLAYARKHDPAAGNKNNGSFDAAMSIMPETRNKRSVWTVPSAPSKEAHFATYPPDLIKPCILAGCPAGGVVLDPFGGSGTTGAVALELGRKAILCELNPKYVGIMRRRTCVTEGLGL